MSQSPFEAEVGNRAPQPNQGQPKRGIGTAVGVGTAAALAKGKGLLVLLKGLPFMKLLLTSGSMFLSILVFAIHGGWAFGVGFVVLLLLHELGHGYAMRRAGVAAGWPIFIPGVGAVIAMQGQPAHPCIEAEIAYAGPIAGTLASLLCAGLGLLMHQLFFIALAYVGFMVNLFNLVPYGFLDGGRVARVLSRRASIVGLILLGLLCLKSPSPMLFFILFFGGRHALRSSYDPALDYVTPEEKRLWSIRYFGLCAFLGACLYFSQQLLHGALS